MLLHIGPIGWLIPLLLDFLVRSSLLLDPGVVPKVVDSVVVRITQLEHVISRLTMEVTGKVCSSIAFGILAQFLVA